MRESRRADSRVAGPKEEGFRMGRISVNGYEPSWLSHSTVSGYRSCGKRFELQKIVRVEQRPGLAAIGGNAVHVATEVYDLLSCADVDNGHEAQ